MGKKEGAVAPSSPRLMEYGCIRLTPLEWSFFVLGLRLPRVELEVVAPVLALLHLEVYPSGFLGVLLEEGNELVDLDADLGFDEVRCLVLRG